MLIWGDIMSTGENIKKARIGASMTQAMLAERIGTTTQNISQYERDIRKPKIETLQKIADALNVNVSELSDNVQHTPILSTRELSALNLDQLRSLLDLYEEMCCRNPSRELQMQIALIQDFMCREQQRLYKQRKLEEQPKE